MSIAIIRTRHVHGQTRRVPGPWVLAEALGQWLTDRAGRFSGLHLFQRDDRTTRRVDVWMRDAGRWRASQSVRCPLCQWRPTSSSEWLCDPAGTPEPPFQACGRVWNTFATKGRCPGCGHQWHWTTCHQCGGCSPHDDWYEEGDGHEP